VGLDAATEPPITARRAQTRQRLMAAARRVFAEHSIEGASVEEICEAAGFSRGAFYSNFSDRSDLVLAMIQQSIQTQFAAAERAIDTMKAAGDLEPDELVQIALSALSGSTAERGTEATEVITDQAMMLYAARANELRQPYLRFVDACSEQVAGLISDALSHAKLELTVPLDAAVELLMATHNHLQTLRLFDSDRADPQLLSTLLAAITRPTNAELSDPMVARATTDADSSDRKSLVEA
jgi:AcrR family transcriptional regulator